MGCVLFTKRERKLEREWEKFKTREFWEKIEIRENKRERKYWKIRLQDKNEEFEVLKHKFKLYQLKFCDISEILGSWKIFKKVRAKN